MTQKNKSLSDSILEEISMKGLGFAKKPNYEIPSLPRDITELDDPALMDLFVQLSQWNDYASGLYAVACVNEREAESALETAQAIGRISGWTGAKGETATKVKAAAAASPDIPSTCDGHAGIVRPLVPIVLRLGATDLLELCRV